VGFGLRVALSKLLPAVFSPPAFQMLQNYDLTYQEVSLCVSA
jgi:hypothetical protein